MERSTWEGRVVKAEVQLYAITVEFELMDPACFGRDSIDRDCKLRVDKSRTWRFGADRRRLSTLERCSIAPQGKAVQLEVRSFVPTAIGERNGSSWCRLAQRVQQLCEETMKIKTISLAAIFALSSTVAMAQSGSSAGGSSQAGGPAASKTTTGESMSGSTTGGGANMKNSGTGPAAQSSAPSAKEPSTQGAGPAGAPDRKGDAASPGGVMKK
ncbi:hypothetical protein CWO90_38495 [Bradyrhizobium sp. Leo121]|nr:hypothetical protein CWO90_38495 [Bradyrhizobium sp. Leo121]